MFVVYAVCKRHLIGKVKIKNQGEKGKKLKGKGTKGRKWLYPKEETRNSITILCCDATPVLFSEDEKLKVQFKEMAKNGRHDRTMKNWWCGAGNISVLRIHVAPSGDL